MKNLLKNLLKNLTFRNRKGTYVYELQQHDHAFYSLMAASSTQVAFREPVAERKGAVLAARREHQEAQRREAYYEALGWDEQGDRVFKKPSRQVARAAVRRNDKQVASMKRSKEHRLAPKGSGRTLYRHPSVDRQ